MDEPLVIPETPPERIGAELGMLVDSGSSDSEAAVEELLDDEDSPMCVPSIPMTPEFRSPELKCTRCQAACVDKDIHDQHWRETETPFQRISAIFEDDMEPAPKVRLVETKARPSEISAIALSLFETSGNERRKALWHRLSQETGQNGITHDALYQVFCFMIDWAIQDPSNVCHRFSKGWHDCVQACGRCSKTQKVEWKRPTPRETKAEDAFLAQIGAVDGVQYSTVAEQERCFERAGARESFAAVACSTLHYPCMDTFKEIRGKANYLGIKGRQQWAPQQIAIVTVMHTIDTVLMLLSIPEFLHCNLKALPILAMVCLALHDKITNDDDLPHFTYSKLSDVLGVDLNHQEMLCIETVVLVNIFDFVLPGQTVNRCTRLNRWLPYKLPVDCGTDTVEFTLWEERAGSLCFHLYDYVPSLDAQGEPVRRLCSPSGGCYVCLFPCAYPKLFECYDSRREWLCKSFN